MQAGVGLDRVVHVVGGDGGEAQLVSQQVEGAQAGAGVRQQLVLQLDEEVAAEDVAEGGGRGAGAGLVAGQQPRPDLAAAAGAERDQVSAVLGERGETGQRWLAGVLEVGGADDAAQVAPALVVAGEEHEVVAACAGGVGGGGRYRGRSGEVADVAVGGEGGGWPRRCGGPRRCGRVWGIGRALRSARRGERASRMCGDATPPRTVARLRWLLSLNPTPALRACRIRRAACARRSVRLRIGARIPRAAIAADGRFDRAARRRRWA